MPTILKHQPRHFRNLAESENAIAFAFAMAKANIKVEVSSVIENGERVMIMRCTNGKEAEFKSLCEQYHPDDIVNES